MLKNVNQVGSSEKIHADPKGRNKSMGSGWVIPPRTEGSHYKEDPKDEDHRNASGKKKKKKNETALSPSSEYPEVCVPDFFKVRAPTTAC